MSRVYGGLEKTCHARKPTPTGAFHNLGHETRVISYFMRNLFLFRKKKLTLHHGGLQQTTNERKYTIPTITIDSNLATARTVLVIMVSELPASSSYALFQLELR